MPPAASTSERPVVLVVDDAPSSLGMLCDTLEASGYTVLVAADGESALQRLELVVPDAILLDGLMPGLSGFETCRRIKANPALAHIPVLFMTGMAETQDVVEGFACGGVDYVVKPIRAQEVLARLHARATRASRAWRATRSTWRAWAWCSSTRDGRVAWRSPQAALWLHALDEPAAPGQLPDGAGAGPGSRARPSPAATAAGARGCRCATSARPRSARRCCCLALQREGPALASRVADAALTPRETEVLSWLAKGKTNRDIAEILGMSPRTVNKHLEHIFEKLGVETRAAAAALATGM